MPALLTLLPLVVSVGSGCSGPTPPHEVEVPADARALPFHEQLVGGAQDDDTALPLVITLHGRGSTPERFGAFFQDITQPMRVVHLQAPIAEHDGRAWFRFRGKTTEAITQEIDELAARSAHTATAAAQARPTVGKPVVVGFSQGAMVVYAMALRHADAFAKFVPISGVMLTPIPEAAADMPPLVALHGERDPIIADQASRRAVRALQAHGMDARLQTFPEAVHWIDGDLKAALYRELTWVRPPSSQQPSLVAPSPAAPGDPGPPPPLPGSPSE